MVLTKKEALEYYKGYSKGYRAMEKEYIILKEEYDILSTKYILLLRILRKFQDQLGEFLNEGKNRS